MDRIPRCGRGDPGSNPGEGISITKNEQNKNNNIYNNNNFATNNNWNKDGR